MRNNHSRIRPAFVERHLERIEADWKRRMQINAAGYRREKDLNIKYGLPDHPSSPYPTTHNDGPADYLAERKLSHDKSQRLYEAVGVDAEAADRAEGMSIWEFMLLDNLGQVPKDVILAAAKRREQVDYVDLRAREELRDQLLEVPLAEMQRRLTRLVDHFNWAGRRCVKFYKLSIIDFSARLAIRDFKLHYRRCLIDHVGKLQVSGREVP